MKIKNIRKRSKCGISVLRKTAGPSVSANQKAPMDDSNTHMRSHRKRPQQPKHTVNPSVCKARPLHPHRSDDHFKGGGRAVCGAVLAWALRRWSLAVSGFWSVTGQLPLGWSSELVHDAVCVVDRDGAVLAQPLPLESCAEGAHLVLLVLLLLGKLHKHLQDKRKQGKLGVNNPEVQWKYKLTAWLVSLPALRWTGRSCTLQSWRFAWLTTQGKKIKYTGERAELWRRNDGSALTHRSLTERKTWPAIGRPPWGSCKPSA